MHSHMNMYDVILVMPRAFTHRHNTVHLHMNLYMHAHIHVRGPRHKIGSP